MNGLSITGGLTAALAFAAVASSLIPAIVIKVLMGMFFQRSVSYLMVLVALVASVFIAFGVVYAMGIQSDAAFAALPPQTTIFITGATLLAQAGLLTIIVSDEIGQRIALWKWIVVLVLQYVLYIAFGLLFALAMSL